MSVDGSIQQGIIKTEQVAGEMATAFGKRS